MSTSTPQPNLPPELLLQIIDCLVPSLSLSPIALPAPHPTTRTLLALTRTSRKIYPTAIRLLYTHCLYIDSPSRLQCVLNTISSIAGTVNYPPPPADRPPRPHPDIPLRPQSLPDVPILKHISSLYLEPFDTGVIDNDDIVSNVYDLLSFLAPVLRRLIIDFPLRSLNTDDDFGSKGILHQAFERLTQLEVFCSVRDELYLSDVDLDSYNRYDHVWSLWPKLRTLALYNVDVQIDWFWRSLGEAKNLKTLILTRPDGIGDINLIWKYQHLNLDVELEILLVNVESDHLGYDRSNDSKVDDRVSVRELNVPTSYYGDEDVIELCQEWVKRGILKGEESLEG